MASVGEPSLLATVFARKLGEYRLDQNVWYAKESREKLFSSGLCLAIPLSSGTPPILQGNLLYEVFLYDMDCLHATNLLAVI